MTFKFDLRRGLGLILIVIGLALPILNSVRQAAPVVPAALPTADQLAATNTPRPTATPIVDRLIPTVAPKTRAAITATLAPTKPASTATLTSSATPRATNTVAKVTVAVATRIVTKSPSSTVAVATRSVTNTPSPTVTVDQLVASSPTPVPATATATATTQPVVVSGMQQRYGIGVSLPAPWIQRLTDLKAGWFLDWSALAPSGRPAGVDYLRMVRVPHGQPSPDLATLASIAQRSPGSLWLIGNEPDVIWQDNATPDQYIQVYHDVYATLKQADPTSRIAIGGVTEPSALRLQYLDLVLNGYRARYGEEMPIDVWNVHNFILPEKRGSWGVDIPPGINVDSGLNVGIDDHDDLARFKEQIVDFRRWMAARGFRDKELIVSEYGVLMYEEFGFDYARVRAFMLGTFDYFLTARDGTVGLPSDDNRLVQRWCWYSLSDGTYPTGNLVDQTTGELTPLGRDFADYVQQH